MMTCFEYAIDHGLSISLSPHLDDGLEQGGWRNTLRFDPLVPYGNYSYADIMLYPLADALSSVLTPSTKVWFGLQGEMGATVMYNPRRYTLLFDILKTRILENSAAAPDNVKMGLGVNFNKLCACVLMDLVDPTLYLQQFPAAIAPILHTFDLEGIQEMFGSADFIAISSYASLKPDFKTPELQSAMYQFDEELKVFNVSIRELFENNGLEFHFAEYGIGGGTAQRGFKKAANEAEVAEFPFFGIYGAYNNQTDPWSMWSDQLTPARRYLHYFYNKTVEMLSADITVNYTASNSQYRTEYVYPVDGLYIWNLASWDVQAIYPDSTTQDGSYRDEYVAQLIRNHNQEMKYRRVTTDVSGARSL
eukprot:TRINITY_DN3411_c0_g1_i2.p2 TRINITY_DN3411_c0_g1~~TRINITY_DN3411_c0_g1_i2.p2  ORF type:complete len:362 (-),score=59.47 TRINITY_DN3411_c0_g1_i2:442-1527(-)